MSHNSYKTVYEAFFGEYIGKKIAVSDDGYYYCGDYIDGRFYYGKLNHVSYSDRGIVLHIDNKEITVDSSTKISIIE